MRKNYIFKRLTESVKHFAALMLIMLIAANSLFADEVTFVFADAGFSNGQVLPDGNINGIISYSADRQGGSSDGPKYFISGSVLRFYYDPANAQGNAMVLTPAFGYQITGLTINALSGYATPVGYVVDGGDAVVINADESSVYNITDIEAGSSLKFYNAATTNMQLRITSITITYTTAEVPVVAAPTFNLQPGVYYSGISLSMACPTPDAEILYTLNDSEFYAAYQSPIEINTTTTVHAFAVLGNDTSAMVHATYEFPEYVNIYGFKHGVSGNLYAIPESNTKMDFVFRDGQSLYFMSENLIQPEGLLVYDNNPSVITTQYEEGETVDVLVGTLSFYNGIPEMIPVSDAGKSVNSTPHTVVPLEVTVAELMANPERYLSALVVIRNGQFEAGTFTTDSKTGVNFVQGTDTIYIYNNFKTVTATFNGGEKAAVIGLVGLYNGVPQIYPRGNNDLIRPQIPYTCSFDGSASYAWTKVNSITNNWYVGNANELFDNNKLYVSSGSGMNNVYNPNIAAVSHAYIDITLPESDVLLSFDCKSVGNAEDFLQVSVLDEAPEEGVLPANYLERFYNVNTFTRQTVLIPASFAGNKKIVFTWRNDNTVGNQTPAAIDNVTIEGTCSMVSEIFMALNGHSVIVNWLYPEGQHAWMLQYKASDADAWQNVNTTSSSVTLNNLSTEKMYDVRVRAICETSFSAWKYAQFIVPCISSTSSPVELTIGDGTTSSTSTPMNSGYGNSWTQMIYPSSNFANPGYINSLSWETVEANALDYNSLKIYLGTTEMSEHATANDWLPLENLTLVYEGNNGTVGITAGWETYTLNNPYYYNAEDNLVVVISRSSNEGNGLYYYYSFANNACLSRSADGDATYAAHPGAESGIQNGFLPNMKIDYQSIICNDVHCAAPTEVSVQNITTNSAAVSWTANGANAWKMSYKAENASDWTIVSITNNQYVLTGLTQNTNYEVRVMSDCGANGTSSEAAAAFTTAADCPVPTSLTVTHHQNNSVITWIPVLGVNNYELQYKKEDVAFWASFSVNNASSFVLGGLAESVTYNVRVRSLCDADEYSDWAELTFTTPNSCEAPVQLTISEIANHSVNVSQDTMPTGSWAIQYGESGFGLGSGTIIFQNTNTIDLTGLAAGTAYDVYAKNICGENSESVWAGPYTFTTEQDSIIELATIPFVEPFNEGVVHDDWINYHFDLSGFVMDEEVQGISISNGMYHNCLSVADNEYTMSPCLNIPAGRYDVAYSFKAMDQMIPESFEVYLCTKTDNVINLVQQVGTETFSNPNMVRKHNFINVEEDGVYCFAIRSVSPSQHLGFCMDDFAVKEVVNFTVTYAEQGTGTPEGHVEATKGELYTLTIYPEPGYHVSAIYKNAQLVCEDNGSNALVQHHTFVPQNGDSLYVMFAASTFEVNATVTNLMFPGHDNMVSAIYAPNHEVVSYGGSHTGVLVLNDHFHIHSVTVNGLDITESLVPFNASQYTLSLDNIVEDKDIQIVTAFDDATIVYTVLSGQGVINNEFVADASTAPVVYTVMLPGNSDLLSTITPAPGYHVSSVVVDGVEHNNIETYSFEHLYGFHTVNVTFSKNHYTISTISFGHGTVSAGAEFDYDPDYVYAFTATPATGYRIGSIQRNHVAVALNNLSGEYAETLTNITSDYLYEVQFVPEVFTVTANSGINGTVSPAGTSSYIYNQDVVYMINANHGYYISSLTIDGETTTFTQAEGLTSITHIFEQITADHSISATFAQMLFTVTVNAGSNGAITPGSSNFPLASTPTFFITPNEGYRIVDVMVDNESVGAVTTYVFTPLTSNHTISAIFAASEYEITAMAGGGGTISDMGTTTLVYNGSKTYTITPNPGFHVNNVYVDGYPVGAVSTYSFNNVTANHTIYAEFAANEYTITVTQPANGVITPGSTVVLNGATPVFVITPSLGYSVSAINVNGTNVIDNASHVNDVYTYVFPAVSADQTITATMTAKTFTINATAGANGSITPSGNTTVYFGNTLSYNINPANGYVVDDVIVDGLNLGALTGYVFTNVVANHTIHVTFRPADCTAPSFMYTSHIDSTSAELHWSHPTATSFDIQYKTPTGNATTLPSIFGSSYVLTGLTPNTTYLWQVRANCYDNNHSEWSNMIAFTTEYATINETGIEDLVKNSIKVYAAHQNVHILNNDGLNIDNVRIFDAYGKLIYNGTVNTTHEVIGLAVAAGTYIVNVTTDKGVANYKVVIMK